jgi:hypothetical protein
MSMNVNPMFLVQAIKQGQNPQQLMLNILENNMSGTPLGDNLIDLAKKGRSADIEMIVRNITKQRGIDFDKEFPRFV